MSRKDLFRKAKTFAVYYGTGRREKLSEFDVVILEPAAWQLDDIKWLQDKNTVVLAYISVMEVPAWYPEIKLLEEEDFISEDNVRLTNPSCGNFLADMDSLRWRNILIHKAVRLLGILGYDGLFLDTMGMAESSILGENVSKQVLAVAEFVKELRNFNAEHIIVQNHGLEKILPLTVRHVDAVCWENPPFGKIESRQWVEKMTNLLLEMHVSYGLKILLLCEKDVLDNWQYTARTAAEFAEKNPAFLYYLAPKDYVHGINPPFGSKKAED